MKVAYITMQFPVPSETFACNDVRTLRKKGVEIFVYGLRTAHSDADRILKERGLENLPLTHANKHTLLRGLAYGLRHLGQVLDLVVWMISVAYSKPTQLIKSIVLLPRALEIYASLQQVQPQIVHIYWGHYPSLVAYLVQRYSPDMGVSVSLSAYDLHTEYGGTGFVAQRADMVKTLARANVAHIEKVFGVPANEIAVIYDSVDLTRFDATGGHTGRLKYSKKKIISIGRLTEGKGMNEVLEVFAAVHKQFAEVELVILGDGNLREALEAKAVQLTIDAATEFKGHVSHESVFDELAQSDIFLFMSESERLPNVVKEAMLSHCICVVTDTVGMNELIPSKDYGYLVSCGDTKQATENVLKILTHPEEHREMAMRAEAYIRKNFDIDLAAESYVKLWKSIMTSKAKDKVLGEQVVA